VVRDHEWERLVSGIFLHAGFLHIIMNSAAILQLGRILELFTTRGRCWFTLLLSGLFGSLTTVLWAEITGERGASVGASGAGCGLGGALIVVSRGVHALAEFRKQLTTWMIVMLGMGFVIPMISGTGHLGGALGGMLAGYFVGKRGFVRMANDAYSRRIDLATKLLTLVFVAALALNAWRTNERRADLARLDDAANEIYAWLNAGALPDVREWRENLERLDLPSVFDRERQGILDLVEDLERLEPSAIGANAELARARLIQIRRR
jgi:hypothetical protein